MAEAATIARPYAKAAFLSARDAKALSAWSDALHSGSAMVADARVADLIGNPKMSTDQVVSMNVYIVGYTEADLEELDEIWNAVKGADKRRISR